MCKGQRKEDATLCVKMTMGPGKLQLLYSSTEQPERPKPVWGNFLLAVARAISTPAGKHRAGEGVSHSIARVRQEAEGNTAEVFLTFLWPEVSED